MPRKIVIIGAVAVGPKAACRIRRLDPDADIVLVDRDMHISYGGCGIPYYVGGDVADLEGLMSTAYHMKRDAGFFKTVKRVDARPRTEATAIDRKNKCVQVTELDSGREYCLEYDNLVLATGGRAMVPPIPGKDLEGVLPASNLHQAEYIKTQVQKGQVESVVVAGAGAIGLEMAEALADLWGVEVTVVEMAPQILPQAFGPEIAKLVENAFVQGGVDVLTGRMVKSINAGEDGKTVGSVSLDDGRDIDCQMVIMATGARPNADLARNAGLAVGPFGGVLVDASMRTSDFNIYAGGDCVEIPHALSGHTAFMPLGSMANRQGRIIANNICGRHSTFPPAVGSFCMKAFESGCARSGMTELQAAQAGYKPVSAMVAMVDRAHFYPTRKMMFMKMIADSETRQVLGIEAVGDGDAVKARVDAVAGVLRYGVSINDIACLEVAYSPPYSQAMDIVNAAATALENVLEGRHETMSTQEFLDGFERGDFKVLDVRTAPDPNAYLEAYPDRWISIPGEDLEDRLSELDPNEPLVLFCNTGQRAYEAQLLLRSKGFPTPRNVQGGHVALSATKPEFLKKG